MSPLLPGRWRLDGRRALITGGTKGIGWAVSEEMLALGASVTIAARGEADLAARVADQSNGGRLAGVAADVSTAEGRDRAVAAAVETMGGIDILVNNAGTNIRRPSAEFAPVEFAFLFDVNLVSAWELSRLAYPLLRDAAQSHGDAAIVNVSSVAAVVSVGSGAPYAMTKAAMDQMTRYLAVEWGRDRVRVNAVLPWYTRTFRVTPYLDEPAYTERVLADTPLGRIAEPVDVSGAVAFLCLPAASYITGATLPVDGGFLSHGF